MWEGQGAGLWEPLKEDKPKYRHPQNLQLSNIHNKGITFNNGINNIGLTGTTLNTFTTNSVSYNMSDAVSFTN